MVLNFYTSEAGNIPVWDFIAGLAPSEQKYFEKALARCNGETIQQLIVRQYLKKISRDLYEIKVYVARKTYRILCAIKNGAIWLLHAFQKKSQKLKRVDIRTALMRLSILNQQPQLTY